MIQITDPTANAAVIPALPTCPVALMAMVAMSSVAMVIPDTGLLLLPTSPTMREDTVAKKNPNRTIKNAENRLTGMTGTSQITNIKTRMAVPINGRGKS